MFLMNRESFHVMVAHYAMGSVMSTEPIAFIEDLDYLYTSVLVQIQKGPILQHVHFFPIQKHIAFIFCVFL